MASSFAVRFFNLFILVGFLWRAQSNSVFDVLNTIENRNVVKRSLVTFPPDSALQINVGITLAGETDKNSGVMGLFFQQNIPLPNETLSLLPPSTVVTAKKFSIYEHLRDVIIRYGFDGAECMKKMICQVGETPLLGGLVEDIVAFVLTPSRHRSIQNDGNESEQENWSYMKLLLESERMGKAGGNCSSAYPLCIRTPLDLISAFLTV